MAEVLWTTTCWNASFQMKITASWFKFLRSYFLRIQLTINQWRQTITRTLDVPGDSFYDFYIMPYHLNHAAFVVHRTCVGTELIAFILISRRNTQFWFHSKALDFKWEISQFKKFVVGRFLWLYCYRRLLLRYWRLTTSDTGPSYPQISWNLVVTKCGFEVIRALCNLVSVSAALLPRRL